MFDRLSYLRKLWKKLKRQVMHKILIMFYHLKTMKIWIIKKILIRRIVKVGYGNLSFVFFFKDEGSMTVWLPAHTSPDKEGWMDGTGAVDFWIFRSCTPSVKKKKKRKAGFFYGGECIYYTSHTFTIHWKKSIILNYYCIIGITLGTYSLYLII
jgi:hypothetical protein